MSKLILMPENSLQRVVFIPQIILDTMNKTPRDGVLFSSAKGGANITLSETEAQKLQLGKTFASALQITDSCLAIQNTVFGQVSPKPSWYDELNGKFGEVKRYADQWVNGYSAAVLSSIPTSVKTYTPTFINSAETITGVLEQGSGELTPAQMQTIRSIYVLMLDNVNKIANKVGSYAREENGVTVGKLADWQANMSAAGLTLKTGNASIQKASADLQDKIAKFEGDIKELEMEIKYYNNLIATGAGLVGGGVAVGVVGIGVCAVFPVVGGIMLAIGILSVVGGAALWGTIQNKINKANQKIIEHTRGIAESKQTILALGTLGTSMDLAVTNAELATRNMVDFTASWLTFGNSLLNTIQAIDDGRLSEERWRIKLELANAMSFWREVDDYAQMLLEAPTEVKVVPASKIA